MESKEWDANPSAENQRGNTENLAENAKKREIRVAMQGIEVET